MTENCEFFNEVKEINFSYGNYLENSVTQIFTKDGDTVTLEIQVFPFDISGPFQRVLDTEEWDNLLDDLFHKISIRKWNDRYESQGILDGTSWSLEISAGNGKEYQYTGYNAYPENWNDFAALFKPYLSKAGIPISLCAGF